MLKVNQKGPEIYEATKQMKDHLLISKIMQKAYQKSLTVCELNI